MRQPRGNQQFMNCTQYDDGDHPIEPTSPPSPPRGQAEPATEVTEPPMVKPAPVTGPPKHLYVVTRTKNTRDVHAEVCAVSDPGGIILAQTVIHSFTTNNVTLIANKVFANEWVLEAARNNSELHIVANVREREAGTSVIVAVSFLASGLRVYTVIQEGISEIRIQLYIGTAFTSASFPDWCFDHQRFEQQANGILRAVFAHWKGKPAVPGMIRRGRRFFMFFSPRMTGQGGIP